VSLYLVVIDTPGIKRYIFESSRLKDIRGASAILDGLNRGWMLSESRTEGKDFEEGYRKLEESQRTVYGGMVGQADGLKMRELVYVNGGSGMLIVEGANDKPETEIDDALACFERILTQHYLEETAGCVAPVVAWTPLKQGEPFQTSRDRAMWRLRRKRGEVLPTVFPSTPWVAYEDGLPARRAEQAFHEADGSISWISSVSWMRREKAREEGRQVWRELETFWGSRLEAPETLETIAGEEKFIAVVYADGNAMGKHIKSLGDSKSFANFSRTVDKSVRLAAFGALKDLFFSGRQSGSVPFDIILLGGDDLLLAMPTSHAALFAVKTAEKFRELTGGKHSLSFGIAYANMHAPFDEIVEQAEWCLKTAKRGASDRKDAGAWCDFHSNRLGFVRDIGRYRKSAFRQGDCSLTARPYRLDEFKETLNKAVQLKSMEVPASRLHAIATSLERGRSAGRDGWIQGIGRLRNDKDGSKQKLLREMPRGWRAAVEADAPWRKVEGGATEVKFKCGFHDVLELYGWCEFEGERAP
jgi:hypothetical protein